MFSLFGRGRTQANQKVIDRMHDEIVAAVRRPAFYVDYGVEDTFAGRFELMVLFAALVIRRLGRTEAPGPALAQDLVDTMFRNLDPGLREMGVGDLAVPKRMKKLAEAFLGRSAAYDAGIRAGVDSLASALSRNVYDSRHDGRRMALYVMATVDALDALDLGSLMTDRLPFAKPEAVS